MKRAAPLVLLVGCFAAACAGGSEGSSNATTASDELNIFELKCRNGERSSTTRFDLDRGLGSVLHGTLITDEGEATLICQPTHVESDAGGSEILISCVEPPKPGRSTNWTVEITTEPGGHKTAHIDRLQEIPGGVGTVDPIIREELACARITNEVPVLPYSVVQGYINRTCNVCHEGQFDSIDKIKDQRDLMLGMISSGVMPKRNPGWRESDEGQLTLQFLAKSPELE